MTINEIKKTIEDCGVVGAGGAGFPTHLKIDPRAKTIILNCAECEPLLCVDKYLLAHYTEEIFAALKQVSEVLDADVVIAVKKAYKKTINSVNEKIQAYPRFRLCLLENIYPIGDEIILIYETLGFVVPPGSLPIEAGCIVFNVETMYNVYHAITSNKPVTEKWVTIAGEVENPGVKQFPVGLTIHDAVKTAGDITSTNPAYILNGLMMGKKVLGTDFITKTTNVIFVLSNHELAETPFSTNLNRAASACCQCRACTDLCPRHLIGYPIEPHRIMRALGANDSTSDSFMGVMHCSGCGICEKIACPQSLAPRELMNVFKNEFKKGGVKAAKLKTPQVSNMLPYRKVDQERLKIRLGLRKYEVPE